MGDPGRWRKSVESEELRQRRLPSEVAVSCITLMENPMPRHVQGAESIRLGVINGWYAVSPIGAICSGPFLTRAACDLHIEQERTDINAYHQGAANPH
jgi:hypothetical protein